MLYLFVCLFISIIIIIVEVKHDVSERLDDVLVMHDTQSFCIILISHLKFPHLSLYSVQNYAHYMCGSHITRQF